jgi:hypothetical protein
MDTPIPIPPVPVSSTQGPIVSPEVNVPPTAPSAPSPFGKYVSLGIAIILIVLVFVVGYLALSQDSGFLGHYLGRLIPTSDRVGASGPIRGGIGMVSSARLSKPGFIVLMSGDHANVDFDRAIAMSPWLPAGMASSVPLIWNEEAYMNRDLTYGNNFFLTVYHDDGDNIFDIRKDTIVAAPGGSFVGVAVKVQ